MLVKMFGWSLPDIDNADMQSLMPFVNRLGQVDGKGKNATSNKKATQIYCDDPAASWL